jgi:polyisoprenoid-binding protein YceI
MLIRNIGLFALMAGILTSTSMAAEKLTLNQEKSKIEFVGKKSDGEHKGGFKEFSADATADHDNPEKGSLKITIQADSLFSDDPRLTAHLKNPDFFDVKKHPTITFESKKIELDDSDEGKATIVGMLKLLDKEETLEVPVTVDNTEEEIVVNAKFKLDRTKWGMTFGEGKIDKDVEVTATLHFKH